VPRGPLNRSFDRLYSAQGAPVIAEPVNIGTVFQPTVDVDRYVPMEHFSWPLQSVGAGAGNAFFQLFVPIGVTITDMNIYLGVGALHIVNTQSVPLVPHTAPFAGRSWLSGSPSRSSVVEGNVAIISPSPNYIIAATAAIQLIPTTTLGPVKGPRFFLLFNLGPVISFPDTTINWREVASPAP